MSTPQMLVFSTLLFFKFAWVHFARLRGRHKKFESIERYTPKPEQLNPTNSTLQELPLFDLNRD